MHYRIDRLRALLRDSFKNLPKRALLTIQYLGWRAFAIRVVTFPLRLTPWGPRLAATRATHWAKAREWYRRHGRKVTVVIPNYGDPHLTIQCVDSIRATTKQGRVRIVVSDDGSAPEHVAALHAHAGIDDVVAHPENTGFAANCNRGFARAQAGDDIVLLNSDVIAMPGWLELLQYGAYREHEVGIAGPKLLYPDGTIQSAGTHRNLGAPEWFDHRYRFQPSAFPPANIGGDMLAMTGAALYIKPDVLRELGGFDEAYGMAYEDVDLCLRSWEAGHRVLYVPESTMTHLESKTRPVEPGQRELDSQKYFWERWGDFFDKRDVRTADGRLKIIVTTHDTGVGGGHRVLFQHMNGLREHGHEVELWSLGGEPAWFDLKVPVRTFEDYGLLTRALEGEDAIKVATWWQTAAHVWRASIRRGIPAFYVQDIETWYYPDQPLPQAMVMASYRHEFRYVAGSQWIGDELRALGVDPMVITPGLDPDTFHQVDGVPREDNVMLAVGRTLPLKNFALTAAGWKGVPEAKRPELWLFGIEPKVGAELGVRYIERPSDAEVNQLYNQATVLIQTSIHEGFCLPLLEAMAAGAATISTDSHGNRDFCRDGENCLIVEPTEEAVSAAIERLFADPDLRARIIAEGLKTAQEFAYSNKLAQVLEFVESVSAHAAGAAPA